MTNEALHIHFTPESQDERIETFQATIDDNSYRLHPKVVHGQLTNVTEEQIVQFELELSPAIINFKGQRYHFSFLDRTGEFTIEHLTCGPFTT